MTFSSPQQHTSPLFKSLELLKLDDIFVNAVLVLFYKLNLDLVPFSLNSFFTYLSDTHNYRTRSANILRLPSVKTARFGTKSIRFSGAKIWNEFYKNISDKMTILSLNKLKHFHKKSCMEMYN